MNKPAIPTMHLHESFKTDPREMILYVLRHFTSIPSKASKTFIKYEASFQKLAAEYGSDSGAMSSMVSNTLTDVYGRLFSNSTSIVVDVKPVSIDESRYDLSIDVQVTLDDEVVNVRGSIKTTEDNQVTFKSSQGDVL